MKKIFFLDIDDCLIETSRLGSDELNALESSLISQNILKADKITTEFAKSFHRLYDFHQGKQLSKNEVELLNQYMSKLKDLEKNIIQEYGQVKKWSREVFIYLAAQKFGVTLSEEQVLVSSTTLWQAITQNTPFYPDALKFLKKLIRQLTDENQPFYLISSSDCRLKYDAAKNQFIYDPDYSRELKFKRLSKFLSLGIRKKNIFIGDPYDKPNLWIFQEALKKARTDNPKKFFSIMVGDSLTNDLLPAAKTGIEKLIWIKRHKTIIPKNLPKNLEIIKSFDELSRNLVE